ncbi:c-type cytochrome [Anaerobaca lacustris]|uniref:C-type cytochrome n=1 Tax=Anaerobaca lacustris TaxID=3044600 RepID=A0AAW6U6G7_9BACT|nr:c-type cytochrome [Sedimentisphaerales bacterium M17dextr]
MKEQAGGATPRCILRIGYVMTSVVGIMCLTVGLLYASAAVQRSAAPLSIEGSPLGEDYPYGSPLAVAVSPEGGRVYVVQHTGRRVDVVDPASKKIVGSIAMAAAPSGLALDTARNRLFVTCGLDTGQVAVIDTNAARIDFTLAAGHTPVAPVVSADGRTLFVCNRFDNEVVAYDLADRRVRRRLAVAREPIAAARTPDDALLVVAHHLPSQAAVGDHVAARVDLIDTASFEIAASVLLPNGSTSVRDLCISPDGRFAYVPHTLGRFGVPTTQVERGWMNTSALSIIDLNERRWLTTVLLDDVDLGAANPWGVVCTADGRSIVVAHSGTHELSVIDRQALHQKIGRVAGGERVSEVSTSLEDIPNDLGFLVGIRRRVSLPGEGPRGVAAAGHTVVAAEYFSDSLAWVDLHRVPVTVTSIALSPSAEPCQIRRGEMAFHDATLCFQQWQSCASCHPDARTDALNWDLLNDGIGNPKNSRSMLHTHATPPVMITGIRDCAETAVRAGFRFIQFLVVPEEVPAAVDAYLKALRPVPSPSLENEMLSASALRGKTLFEQANCAACHSGRYYTDGKLHGVGLGPDERGITEFVTPPLVELWRTAPYLYDGRARTVEEVLTTHNRQDMHGKTSDLSEEEISDLAAYILSL